MRAAGAALGTLVVAGCVESMTECGVSVSRVEIAPQAVSLAVGDSVQLTTVVYGRCSDRAVVSTKLQPSWDTQSGAVATVDARTGRLVARAPGQTSVRATVRGAADTIPVVVR